MKKMYFEYLPKHKSGANKGRFDWSSTVGHKCKFIYEDVEGEITITEIKDGYIYFVYNDKTFKKGISHFKNCEMADVIGKISMKHHYSVGDIINGCEILEQTRKLKDDGKSCRSYTAKCLRCGTITEEKLESTFVKGGSCAVCASRLIVKGINDITTTHPDYVKYFVHIEDAENNSYASNKKRLMKCPNCGNEQMCTPNYLTNSGFPCKKCGDGVSYPNKLMFNVLTQIGIDFEPEYRPKWVDKSRYDFYIPSKKLIVEMDGMLHYQDNNMSNLTQEETEHLDKRKEDEALLRGIKTIRIDSRKSDIKYISNNIKNSGLLDIINDNMTEIDWIACHKFACSSRVKEACDLWNNGIRSTYEIAKIMKLYPTTIAIYLKKGKHCGMCDYDPKQAMIAAGKKASAKRVYTKKEKGIPMSIISAAKRENILRDICKDFKNGLTKYELANKYNYATETIVRFLKDGTKKGWCCYDNTEKNAERLKEMQLNNKKTVLVYKEDKFLGEYDSASEIDRKSVEDFGEKLDFRNVSAVCRGKRKSYKGYVFKFKENR